MTNYTPRPDLRKYIVECTDCERVFNRQENRECPYCTEGDDG